MTLKKRLAVLERALELAAENAGNAHIPGNRDPDMFIRWAEAELEEETEV